jgi:hypothetical protein
VTHAQGKIVYSESHRHKLWFGMFVGFGTFFSIAAVASLFIYAWASIFWAVWVLIMYGLYRALSPLVFEISEREIVFGFPCYHKTFKRSDLIACQPYKMKFFRNLYEAVGIARDRTLAPESYPPRPFRDSLQFLGRGKTLISFGWRGPGIRLQFKNHERAYAISVDKPEIITALVIADAEAP